MDIKSIFPMLGANIGHVDGRNPSATKKGPGRKPVAGHKKGKRGGPKRYMKRVENQTQQSQTANVTNTPLKAATRGG